MLEGRLRQSAGRLGVALYGVALVDAVLTPGKETLIFSSHRGEQDGVKMLYRGAMQFVRNPPMHKLIEYSESTARPLIRLIDSLLLLLDEGETRVEGEVTVDDVRLMLTRRPIPEGQRMFYKVLYQAGDRGLSSSELAEAITRTRTQLAGVLGALGRRINNTKGLKGKGGIGIVLGISMAADGEYRYSMRSVLRQALEIEHIV